MPVKQLTIPYVPPQVAASDLQSNGKLLTDTMIELVQSSRLGDGRHRVLMVDGRGVKLPFAVIIDGEQLYAVYSGKKPLGEGAYGKVKLAQDLMSGEWYAIKIQGVENSGKDNIVVEQSMLEKLDEAVCVGLDHHSVAFERDAFQKSCKQHYMLLKYHRGYELFYYADNLEIKLSPACWLKLVIAILQATVSIHQRHIIHRDIKLENYLSYLAENEISIIDFGFAGIANEENQLQGDCRVGSVGYLAPELASANNDWIYNEKTEVYALGVSLSLLLGMATSPAKPNNDSLSSKIKFYSKEMILDPAFRPSIFGEKIATELFDYLNIMTHQDPAFRPTLLAALDFFKDICLRLEDRAIHVGLLDVTEYDKSKHDLLRQYDYIWLVDTKMNKSLHEYANLRQILEQSGVRVGDRLYVGVRAKVLAKALTHQLNTANSIDKYKIEVATEQVRPAQSTYSWLGLFRASSDRLKTGQKARLPTQKSSKRDVFARISRFRLSRSGNPQ